MPLTPINLNTSYSSNAASATDKVSAANVDVDHLALENWLNTILIPLIAKIMRSDDTLVDQLVRYRNLHPEVITSLQAGLGSATIAVPADASVSTAKIQIGAVTNDRMAANAVTTAAIADTAVVTSKLADQAVSTVKLADLGVSTAKIATNAVDNTKLAQMAPSTFKGNNSTTLAANPRDMSPLDVIALLPAFTKDLGTGGGPGLVPGPGAGDAAAGKVLGAGGTWVIPATIQIYSDTWVTSRRWR